ncbi:HAD hydrolase-like protein [Elizabethkingia anophelis]|uniref:Uncharacterized protein n=1 Tax=Elizabethkingia anophelis TaxID=1117645 RepID=A0AAU8VAV4_9FLAO|nr:HAD hydrolase-like protein [Elizabethkingia anophelis]AQX00105.1 hypothetical protein BBD32_00830 [Elizabethkingia anophelis]KGT09017.1 hypothetical protein NV63_11000 [Elizabethkingia anophelis]MDV3566372.1 hypothetical protein [Elizabethkingia anophelis]MDV3874483.1 hypothetical protein [Elizabethkingia anophelis]MDV3970921.1 hypothetical protein [Elizabethkingia anophelis]
MENTNDAIQEICNKIEENTVLFFDMDGTLVNTKYANFLSYKEAVQSVTKSDLVLTYDPQHRFNRSNLKDVAPNLSEIEYNRIIKEKEINYKKYLHETSSNSTLVNILSQYSKTNQTVLVTNCREERALMTLDYYNLTDKFSNLFFRVVSDNENRINKYKNAITNLKVPAEKIIVFENEKQEIDDAILSGILINNILSF